MQALGPEYQGCYMAEVNCIPAIQVEAFQQRRQLSGTTCVLATEDTMCQEPTASQQPRTLGNKSPIILGSQAAEVTQDARWQVLSTFQQPRMLRGPVEPYQMPLKVLQPGAEWETGAQSWELKYIYLSTPAPETYTNPTYQKYVKLLIKFLPPICTLHFPSQIIS